MGKLVEELAARLAKRSRLYAKEKRLVSLTDRWGNVHWQVWNKAGADRWFSSLDDTGPSRGLVRWLSGKDSIGQERAYLEILLNDAFVPHRWVQRAWDGNRYRQTPKDVGTPDWLRTYLELLTDPKEIHDWKRARLLDEQQALMKSDQSDLAVQKRLVGIDAALMELGG